MNRCSFVLVALAALAACARGPADASPPREVLVCAATSLRDALQEIAPEFERAHAARVVFAFGASGDLARQILAADRADAFVSADEREMDRLEDAERIDVATRRAWLGNQLVVVAPAGAPSAFGEPFDPAQIAGDRVARLSLANVETVPAGRYARAWLERRGLWERVQLRVVPAVDARAALAAVESGACAAGIVYRTDALRSPRVRVVFAVPAGETPPIRYAAAAILRGGATELGRAFVEHLVAREACAVFERHGFAVLDGSAR